MEEVSVLKIRIKFAKQGSAKFIGHLDVMRYFQKVMRKAEVDIRYSEGFNPHQIMSFAAPLGVGLTSTGEYVDIEVLSSDSSTEMLRRMNDAMVEGFEALSFKKLEDNAGNAMSIVGIADYEVSFREGYEPDDFQQFKSGFESYLSQAELVITKKTKKGEKQVDIRPMVKEFRFNGDGSIFLKLATGSAANLKPELLMDAYYQSIGQERKEFALLVERKELYMEDGKSLDEVGCNIE